MSEPKYVPIFCENKRRADIGRWPRDQAPPGRCYATLTEGVWRCTCCKKKVRVVW